MPAGLHVTHLCSQTQIGEDWIEKTEAKQNVVGYTNKPGGDSSKKPIL